MFISKIKYILLVSMLLLNTTSYALQQLFILSTDNPESSLHVYALQNFSALLNKYSNNQISCKVHYRGNQEYPAIGGEESNVDMLINNKKEQLTVTVVATGNASVRAPILEFLMLPYFFESKQEAENLFSSAFMREEVNHYLATKHNLYALGWLIGGFRHVTNSAKPIYNLTDISGLKIRTPRNRTMNGTYSVFGANAIAANWGDVFTMLQSGEIDGQENPYSVILDSKFWLAGQKYISENGPFLWTAPILINYKFFTSLPKDVQDIIKRAGQEAQAAEWQHAKQAIDHIKKQLIANGMQINQVKDKREWVEKAKLLWNDNVYRNIGYSDPDLGHQLVLKAIFSKKPVPR